MGVRSMTLGALVQAATSAPITDAMIDAICTGENRDRQRLYDAFAKEVAEGYSGGRYAWPDADVAMNRLFAYAYAVTGEGLSDYAFGVYVAFDEGEHREGGESVTVALLSKLYESNG